MPAINAISPDKRLRPIGTPACPTLPKAGRTLDAPILSFDSTGTFLQDVAAASIYQRAARASGHCSIDLGAAA